MILDARDVRAGRRGRPDHRAASTGASCRGGSRPSCSRRCSRRTPTCARPSPRSTRRCPRSGGRPPPPPPPRGSRSPPPRRTRSRSRRAQPIVKEQRYVSFVAYGGISVRRQGVQGLHVHVGMPSAEECWRCLEAILPWLPVVLALSANSPWYSGELTGMASNRAPVLDELPRAGRPAGVRVVRGVGGVGRAPRALGVTAGLHAHLVGRAPASGARHARGPRSRTSRPTCGCRRRSLRSCRRCARPRSTAACRTIARCSATAAAPTTPRTAGPPRASGPARRAAASRRRQRRDAPRARRRAARARAAGGTRARRRVRARPARPGVVRGGVAASHRHASQPPRISWPAR